jgi:hypothetical protein
MINDDAARHFAKATLEAGRVPSFIFETMTAYYGNVGREAALAVLEEREGNNGQAEGVASVKVAPTA